MLAPRLRRTRGAHLVAALTLTATAVAACGGGAAGSPDAAIAPPDAAPVAMTLTSSALAEGSAFAADNTCTGSNVSPPLAWTAGPTGTQSYALVLTDQSNALVHWVIYDIPPTLAALPGAIDPAFAPTNVVGAHQTLAYDNASRGYLGPCPPSQHTYQFEVHALDVAALPGASTTTTRSQATALIAVHQLASATLTGTYAQP